ATAVTIKEPKASATFDLLSVFIVYPSGEKLVKCVNLFKIK
ncbi:MAG: hypothetical protein ACI8WB_002812, partial [Phenylobacterium sp.]